MGGVCGFETVAGFGGVCRVRTVAATGGMSAL